MSAVTDSAPLVNNEICEDYKCAVPSPRSSFAQEDGPLCASLAEFLYDPANCEPGYWCGCSSTDPLLCFPSNDTSITRWGGYYKTTNETTGEEIILTGWFDGESNICPPGYYCPGKNEPYRCVDLCEPKMVCPNPSVMEECPDDKFCPVATTVPMECDGLELCNGSGLRRFKTGAASGVILVYLVLSVFAVYFGRYMINKRARINKEMKMKAKKEKRDTEDGEDDEEGAPVPPPEKPRTTTMHRRSSVSAPQLTVDIEFDDLRLTVPNVGTIMRAVTGKLNHGQLTAVMGPSGAGKTTFLTLMSGKIDRTGGVIRVNGEETELTKYRNVIGYVPQEDVMLRDLTVEENITHSALMRLPNNWSYEKKMEQVEEIMEALEISHVRNTVVGDERKRGISGGQLKRVNIAMEMVTKPSLLCLDEPTSGLDSTAAFTVIQSLKDMALSGANIVSVIHQPKYEVFCLFDRVLLLGKGGITVYHGPTEGMKDYFEKRGYTCPPMVNPADYYMDVLAGVVDADADAEKALKLEDLFEEWMVAEENPDRVSPEQAKAHMELITNQASKEDKETKKNKRFLAKLLCSVKTELFALYNHLRGDDKGGHVRTRDVPGSLSQARLLFKRACLQRFRNPGVTLTNIVLMMIAGSILPALVPSDANLYVGIPNVLTDDNEAYTAYLQQNVSPVDELPGVLLNIWFFMLIVSCLSVNVLGSERSVFFRETATGQYVFSYWLAKTAETLLWLPAYTAAFTLLGYSSDAWLLQSIGSYYVMNFLALVGFYGFGMVASLLVGAGSAALLALVFGIIVIIGFSGTVNAYGDESAGSQGFINCWFLFWSTQGLIAKEYDEYRYAFDVDLLNAQTPGSASSDFGSGETTVGAGVGMGFDLSSTYGRNVVLCALTAFAWHLIVLWTLKTKDHRRHR